MKNDVIIIGAGAAGLAAADRLSRAGVKSVILEARPRIGGRVFTVRDPFTGSPIELGAEFVHGTPAEILDHASGLHLYEASGSHFFKQGGELAPNEGYWEQIGHIIDKADEKRSPDRSVHDFLHALEGEVSKEDLHAAAAYIEGFHAADLKKMGEQGLASAEQASGGDEASAAQIHRFHEGYSALLETFIGSSRVHLNTVVESVRWQQGDVTLQARKGSFAQHFQAKKLLITVPLGVLQAEPGQEGAIRFDPALTSKQKSLNQIQMGHALRIVFRFHKDLWSSKASEPVGFLHGKPTDLFPVWWTSRPLQEPRLTAWSGGPKARTDADLVSTALSNLADLLTLKIEDLLGEVQSWHVHDWSQDPYSRGAYSYIGVGGNAAAAELAQSLQQTLYFAGEATHTGAARGTVDGALATGFRAADEILKDL